MTWTPDHFAQERCVLLSDSATQRASSFRGQFHRALNCFLFQAQDTQHTR